MRKLKLFLDTSVISHIVAPHKPYEEVATQAFFRYIAEHRDEYDLVISPMVKSEIEACPSEQKKDTMVSLIRYYQIQILEDSNDAEQLARTYFQEGVLAERHISDLTHIAYAVINGCDYILSWNFKHFVNIKTMTAVNAVNTINHYHGVTIISPPTISGEVLNDKV